jgi:hypothetical protein
MMLSIVISTRAGGLALVAGPGDCADRVEIVNAATKAAAAPTLNRFIDV